MGDDDWGKLVDNKLLRPEEKRALEGYRRQQHTNLLLYWAGDVAKEGLDKAKVPGSALNMIMRPLFLMRDEQQDLLDVMDLPLPFQYFHLLNAMVFVNLILWGYAMAVN